MSSSYRNGRSRTEPARRAGLRSARRRACERLAGATAAVAFCGCSLAAQVFIQPMASLTAGYDTNIELSPDQTNKIKGEVYSADAGALFGIATPTSQTTIKPDVRYEYYPQDTSVNRLDALLDLNSVMTWRLDKLSIAGRYDRKDDLNAEIPTAQYDTVNPGIPTTPSTGHVSPGVVRNNLYLTPTYIHSLSALTGFGITGTYQKVEYSPSDSYSTTNPNVYYVNYNYYQAKPYFDWNLSPRTDLQFGAFATKYDATNIDSSSKAYGAEFDYHYNWSPILRTDVTLIDQETKIDQVTPPPVFQASSNNWGATIGTTYQGLVDQVRLGIGRTILPSSGGALYNTDQAQLQYSHQFTQRLTSIVAVLYQKTGTLKTDQLDNTRNYGIADFGLKYMLSALWYVKADYAYAWQKFAFDPNSANNNAFTLQVGYQGLGRQY